MTSNQSPSSTPPPPGQEQPPDQGVVAQLWRHPWGRVLMGAMTIAVVFWAIRETAIVTTPILSAVKDILLPLAIGFTIAYVLSPLIDRLVRWGLHRVMVTLVIFTILSVLTVAVISLVLPAVLRQGSDLGQRMVSEFYYVDVDNDGRFSRGDIRVRPLPGRPGFYFEDNDGSGEWSVERRVFEREIARVRLEPSLMAKFGHWVDRQAGPLRRVMGLPLSEEAQRELAFYLDETAELIDALDRALAAAREGRLDDDDLWPVALSASGPLPVSVERLALRWPGVLDAEVRRVAAGLGPELETPWLVAMAAAVQRYHRRHRSLQAAGEYLRKSRGEETETVIRLRQVLEQDLSSEDRQRLTRMYDRLLYSQEQPHGEYAQSYLAMLRDGEEGGSEFLRGLAQRINDTISGELGGVAGTAGDWVRRVVSNIPTLLALGLNVVLVPIYAFFLTLALPQIRSGAKVLTARYAGEAGLRIAHAIERVVAAFFRGRLIVCAICALLVYLGFMPLQVPYAALFAILIGLATAVPLAGLIFLVPAVLLMLLDGGDALALRVTLVIGVYTVVQTLEATVFTPMIMGREVELHPVVLIVALLFFGKLFGILGLILAVPIAATVRILWREFIQQRLDDWSQQRALRRQHSDEQPAA
ncbi:MAG: AI-2E family transporter [Planctomycetota bacterium]|nr:MAG: AI-2E family transporter [Planctomycetota bacterium]